MIPILLLMITDFPPLEQPFQTFDDFIPFEQTYEEFIGEDLIGSSEYSGFVCEKDPCHEPETLEPDWTILLKRYAKAGTTVIDYGARRGGRTLALAELVGIDGKVISFEHNPEYFRGLFWNLVKRHIHHATIFCPREAVYIDDYSFPNVSLMIIDAMGKEDIILKKAWKTIHDHRPTMILNILGGISVERSDRYLRKEFERRIDDIRKMGYSTQKITDTWFLALPLDEPRR